MDTQPDLIKVIEQQALFMYVEGVCDSKDYRHVLEFMVMSTVLRNAEITHNQLRGLLRNQCAVPEYLTSETVNKLLSMKVTGSGDDLSVLICDVVKHNNNGVTHTVEHLRCHPLLRSQAAITRVYAGNDEQLFKQLEAFTPERYRRKSRAEVGQ